MQKTTRRTWLAGATAGVLAAQQNEQAVRLPTKVRVGLIGLVGHSEQILGPLRRLPDVELVAVAGSERLRGFPAAKRYPDYRQMLDSEKFDIVGVCNSNEEREAAVLACLDHKVHVAAEKPMSTELAGLARIRKAVAASGVQITTLLPMRYDPMYLALKQIVSSGEIGEVIQIGAQKSYKLGQRPDWYKKRSTYGGTIAWIGIHMIDLMRWTSGREFTEAFSMNNSIGFPEIGEMDNIAATMFRLDNGGVGALRMDFLRPAGATTHGDDRLRLAGTKGIAEYQASTGVTLMTGSRAPQVVAELPPQGSLFVDFLRSIYLGAKPTLTQADVFRVTEIALLARDSAEKHQIVKL